MIGRPCTKCGEWKPLKDFHRDKSRPDGRGTQCKECRNAHGRQYYAESQERRDATAERTRRYYKAHPEEMLEYMHQYRKDHNEEYNARQRKYAARSHGRRNAWMRQKYADDPRFRAQVKASSHRHRARKINAEGSFSEEEWLALCDEFDWCCAACGIPHEDSPLEMDHVVPLSKGGTNWIENIQPLCRSCNARKGAQAIDFRQKE